MKRVKKIKNASPKDINFQIWKHQSPLSIAQHVCYEMLTNSEMLNNFYIQHESFKLSIVKKVK